MLTFNKSLAFLIKSEDVVRLLAMSTSLEEERKGGIGEISLRSTPATRESSVTS